MNLVSALKQTHFVLGVLMPFGDALKQTQFVFGIFGGIRFLLFVKALISGGPPKLDCFRSYVVFNDLPPQSKRGKTCSIS